MSKQEYTITVYTENQIGLLNRIAIIFSRRKININSLNTSPSEVPGIHRFNIVIDETEEVVKKLGEALRTINPKGCFLWNAVRPGNYSQKLLECARRYARTKEFGFASNVYESDLRPTFCSDINTNAMILESLAHIKHGRRPLLEIAMEHRNANDIVIRHAL